MCDRQNTNHCWIDGHFCHLFLQHIFHTDIHNRQAKDGGGSERRGFVCLVNFDSVPSAPSVAAPGPVPSTFPGGRGPTVGGTKKTDRDKGSALSEKDTMNVLEMVCAEPLAPGSLLPLAANLLCTIGLFKIAF